MSTTTSFGYWVRRQRMALDLTQQALAERAACSVSAIKKIEQDTRRPSQELAESIADALAIPASQREQFLRSARGLVSVDRMPLAHQPHVAEPVAAGVTGHFPAAVTTFFGRESELTLLDELLSARHTRLVTLTGVGGVGKTHLAQEAARRAHPHFPDGVWWVPLAGVSDPEHMVGAVASAMDFTFAGPENPLQQLIRHLRGHQQLLVLDNFEQLLPAGADILAALVSDVPDITLLVTTRERLRLQGEVTVPVGGVRLETARTLFLERAHAVNPNVATDAPEEVAAIEAICRLVDGLPLAVVLAAAWTRLLPPHTILAELERSVDLLTSDLRDLPERHRNIEALFNASWQRLSPDEQQLLANLSVFADDFSLEAARAVGGASLSQMAALLDRSLLQNNEERFSLHELVRQFASGKLDSVSGERATVGSRHCDYYLGILGRLSTCFKQGGPELVGWQQNVEREMDNIRAAWQWAVLHDQPQRLLPAALALYLYLDVRGHVSEGAQLFARFAESAARVRTDGNCDDILLHRSHAVALTICGAFGMRTGSFRQAKEQVEAALALLEGLDAPDDRVMALVLRATIMLHHPSIPGGAEAAEEALTVARQENHLWGQALALTVLGIFNLDQPEKARTFLEESVFVWGDQLGLAYGKARAMVHLGLVRHALGDYDAAASLQEAALALARQVQDHSFIALSINNLAFAWYAQGKWEQAERGFRAGLADALQFNLLPFVVQSILGLGMVAVARGETGRAVTILTFGLAQPGPASTFLLAEPQRLLDELRTELAPALFAAVEARGLAMQLPELLSWL